MSEESVTPEAVADPKSSPTYRAAKVAVIILSVLIVLAFGALVVGLVMKMTGTGPKKPGDVPMELALPEGASIVSMQVADNRLILRVKSAAGEEVDIIDTRDGKLIARVKAK